MLFYVKMIRIRTKSDYENRKREKMQTYRNFLLKIVQGQMGLNLAAVRCSEINYIHNHGVGNALKRGVMVINRMKS